ncbi:MAG: S1 RNA-binding domain-containing protein, partial [Verrucomicrobia bacterium]|nr:S1 RNA-binding domain-containing protein [Verrucomicrobiota bacterium]
MLKQFEKPLQTGQIVKGTVIEVRPKEVIIDVGGKSEGVVAGSEIPDFSTLKVGDTFEVLVERAEDKDGNILVSREKAEFKQNWD